jgi:hypothetical protein
MEPGDLIPVTLSAAEWNQVLAVLGEGPFRVVAPLITQIHGQALRTTAGPLDANCNGAPSAPGLSPGARTEAPLVPN